MPNLCLGCGNELPQNRRKYCTTNCGKRHRYSKDPSYYKQYQKDNRESKSEYNKRWFEANPHLRKDYNLKYYQHNKPVYYLGISKRRARKLSATPNWLTKEQNSQIKEFYWLAQDLQKVTGEVYHVDHIVPLSGRNVCGLHVPWNLQVLPADMNLSKSNKFDTPEKEEAYAKSIETT